MAKILTTIEQRLIQVSVEREIDNCCDCWACQAKTYCDIEGLYDFLCIMKTTYKLLVKKSKPRSYIKIPDWCPLPDAKPKDPEWTDASKKPRNVDL